MTLQLGHTLYKDADADAPDAIKDGNGDVVLDMCRTCRRAESQLAEPCSTLWRTDLDKAKDGRYYPMWVRYRYTAYSGDAFALRWVNDEDGWRDGNGLSWEPIAYLPIPLTAPPNA